MPRIVKGALVQAAIPDGDAGRPIDEIKRSMIEKHVGYLADAARQGAQVVCFHALNIAQRGPRGSHDGPKQSAVRSSRRDVGEQILTRPEHASELTLTRGLN